MDTTCTIGSGLTDRFAATSGKHGAAGDINGARNAHSIFQSLPGFLCRVTEENPNPVGDGEMRRWRKRRGRGRREAIVREYHV